MKSDVDPARERRRLSCQLSTILCVLWMEETGPKHHLGEEARGVGHGGSKQRRCAFVSPGRGRRRRGRWAVGWGARVGGLERPGESWSGERQNSWPAPTFIHGERRRPGAGRQKERGGVNGGASLLAGGYQCRGEVTGQGHARCRGVTRSGAAGDRWSQRHYPSVQGTSSFPPLTFDLPTKMN